MGSEAKIGEVSTMTSFIFAVVQILFFSSLSWGHPSVQNLGLRYSYQLSLAPLSTERVWTLDPSQRNPHLQRWVISRRTSLVNLEAVAKKNGTYGVRAEGISTIVDAFVRAPGPWYRPWSDFPCTPEPNFWFSTQEGTKYAASIAGEHWQKFLKEQKVRLELVFERIIADSKELALERGDQAFQQWLRSIESLWRTKETKTIRNLEWKHYLSEAKAQKICPKKKTDKTTQPVWSTMMEPPTGSVPAPDSVLARAPARLWGGLFTVRLNIDIGGRILNGRFLIDTMAPKSVISPDWLDSQGINPVWVGIPGASPQKVQWSGLWENEAGLARPAYVDKVEMSGLEIPMNEFLIYETEFFAPPNYVGSCCDGVLGTDFLRHFPMEFRSEGPIEIRVWPREDFRWTEETPWIEVNQTPSGDLMSSCWVQPSDDEGRSKNTLLLPGVRWDTGEDDPLNIHVPWQSKAKQFKSNRWQIQCEGVTVSKNVPGFYPRPITGASAKGQLATQVPAVTLGIPVLTSSGSFIFDLPHGRLWLPPGKNPSKNFATNQSGLSLVYQLNRGDRELRVKSIRSHSPADSLIQAGLKVGMQITQIDSIPAEELDAWDVEQKLAGKYKEVITLQWKTKSGLKMAPFRVRPEPEKPKI
jgi:hypothetical protein